MNNWPVNRGRQTKPKPRAEPGGDWLQTCVPLNISHNGHMVSGMGHIGPLMV
jgi:hypothetical protein